MVIEEKLVSDESGYMEYGTYYVPFRAMCEKLGYAVEPRYNDKRADIVQNIIFKDRDLLIKYCQGIQ